LPRLFYEEHAVGTGCWNLKIPILEPFSGVDEPKKLGYWLLLISGPISELL